MKVAIVTYTLAAAAIFSPAATGFAQETPSAVVRPAADAALLPGPAGGTQSIVVNNGGAVSVIVLPAANTPAAVLEPGTGPGAAASTSVRFQRPAPSSVAVMESDQGAGANVGTVAFGEPMTGVLQQIRPEFLR